MCLVTAALQVSQTLTLLHSERPKLYGVLAVLSAKGSKNRMERCLAECLTAGLGLRLVSPSLFLYVSHLKAANVVVPNLLVV